MSGVQHITLGTDEAEQRLDRWLRRRFAQLTQGRIEKMCRKGELRVNGGRARPATRIGPGDKLRIPPLPDATARPPARPRNAVTPADAQMIREAVIYRDDHIIALNKPPGLAVQGGSKQSRHVDALAEALRFGLLEKPRLVHRLDKDTSGVLVMARTGAVASALTRAFRARTTRKIYWALVAGLPVPRMGTIRLGLVKAAGHGPDGAGERMHTLHPRAVDDTPGARHATTEYAVLANLGGRAAWLALVPVTGRTHQLRAHMAALGHPIIGDGKYGGSAQENLGDGWGAGVGGLISRKLHLHARSLRLTHPITGKPLLLSADLPEHMAASWQALGLSPDDAPADPFTDDRAR